MVTLIRLLHFICLERKKPCTLVCFKKNPDSGLSTSLWIFPPHHGRESTADTSVFIGFLNGERLAMNRLRFLLIIINNASLPIYLSRTHTPLLLVAPTSSVTHNPSPIIHIMHTCSHIHAHHTHTNPHYSHTDTFFSCSPPPHLVPQHQSHPFPFFTSSTHLTPPSSPLSSFTSTCITPNLTTPARLALRFPWRQEQKKWGFPLEAIRQNCWLKKKPSSLKSIQSIVRDWQPSGYS